MGSIAEIRIPSELAYGKKGIPRISALSKPAFAVDTECHCWLKEVKGEALSKLSACSPGIVPPDCELIFEVHILEADGVLCAKDQCDRLPPAAVPEIGPNDFHHPWWLARVESLGISWHIPLLCQVSQVQGIGETWQDNKLRKLVKTLENVHCCPLLFTAHPF